MYPVCRLVGTFSYFSLKSRENKAYKQTKKPNKKQHEMIILFGYIIMENVFFLIVQVEYFFLRSAA